MSSDKTTIGDRMKEYYENRYRIMLTNKVPVIIRIDGCHFHSFTRGFKKPFDEVLIKAMQLTALDLCKAIQGCKFGYVQSDEISLVLTDFDTINTNAWFDNNMSKIDSVSASFATLYFNKHFRDIVNNVCTDFTKSDSDTVIHCKKLKKFDSAYFDSRSFNIPEDEIVNYFIWRQNDATRNSIQGLAQSLFSHKELQGLNNSQLQDKLMLEKNVNWNDCSVVEKRGTSIVRTLKGNDRTEWIIDENNPIFTQDKEYITNSVYCTMEINN